MATDGSERMKWIVQMEVDTSDGLVNRTVEADQCEMDYGGGLNFHNGSNTYPVLLMANGTWLEVTRKDVDDAE